MTQNVLMRTIRSPFLRTIFKKYYMNHKWFGTFCGSCFERLFGTNIDHKENYFDFTVCEKGGCLVYLKSIKNLLRM